jgi:hypothetical protein
VCFLPFQRKKQNNKNKFRSPYTMPSFLMRKYEEVCVIKKNTKDTNS